jgi:hypothetical protein
MSVTFRSWGESLASSRYRATIPAQQIHRLGVQQGTDWLVIGKHGWDWDRQTKGFKQVCFDICDDHFDKADGEHYRLGCKKADLVSCNSEEMARVIKERTGRNAVVIPDPYEQREQPARVHDRLLWFGHQSNLIDILPWVESLRNLEIVSGARVNGITQWSPEAMEGAFERAGLVIIPTGKSMAKSGNRAIESLRRGLFVVAGYLPAYGDLGIYTGNIADGVQWALSHQDEVIRRIKASQNYIRDEYSPERIAALWKAALFG